VADTGIGMTPAQLERIFLPFEQVGDTRRRAEGTGLGLAITQRLVEAMAGKLEVKSEFGRGSLFCLELEFPALRSAAEAEQKPDQAFTGYAGQRRKEPDPTVEDITPPPPAEIAILFDLAMKGEIPRLRQRAIQLAQMGQEFQPFAHLLEQLTNDYEEDQILKLVKRYM
jgi:hypothetical protein